MKNKRCYKCDTFKSLDQFSKHSKEKDGLQSECKQCDKEYRNKNKDKAKAYRENNREYFKKYHREYYIKQKEKEFLQVIK